MDKSCYSNKRTLENKENQIWIQVKASNSTVAENVLNLEKVALYVYRRSTIPEESFHKQKSRVRLFSRGDQT